MNTYDDDRTAHLLTGALAEEAASVDPSPGGLQAIQRRTASTRLPRRRPWVVAAVGAGLATAAVITTVVLASQGSGPAQTPAAGTSNSGATQQSSVHRGVFDPGADAGNQFTMFYVGSAQARSVLPVYTEIHTIVEPGTDPTLAALNEFLTSTPLDKDYSSLVPASVRATAVDETSGVTTIALTGPADAIPEFVDGIFPGLKQAVQILLLSAGIDGPARFTYNGLVMHGFDDADVYPTITVSPFDSMRAPITIDNLVDGQTVTSPVTIQVSGNTFEGNVVWSLKDSTGSEIDHGYVTTSQGTWTQAPIELGTLAPGRYTITCWEPSGKDGGALFTEDKAFTVE